MEQRLTLISDPTDEFAQNQNNSFKMRIPNGLRLEGKGWHVALLSLTLPNSDGQTNPLISGHDKTIAKAFWSMLHFQGATGKPRDIIMRYTYTTVIKEPHVKTASDGIAFWRNMVQDMEDDVLTRTLKKKRARQTGSDPNPSVFVKESMCPSFYWDGEHLILRTRGMDVSNGRAVNTSLYSYFDMAYEVALQWGFVRLDARGKVTIGPNLRLTVYQDEITSSYPRRVNSLAIPGISTLNGPALQGRRHLDLPRSPLQAAKGSSVYDVLWYYTKGSEKWVRLTGHVEWHFTNLRDTYQTIHRHKGKAVMVYTDLQESNMVGSVQAQLLRQLVVRQGGQEGHSYAEPVHLEWIPVTTRQTDSVEVQLADVDGKLLTLPMGKTLLTVALKQMV